MLDTRIADTLVRELLSLETKGISGPVERLTKAVKRTEQLLESIGYVDTAKQLAGLRAECEEFTRQPVPTPAVVGNGHDPLTGRPKRRKAVTSG